MQGGGVCKRPGRAPAEGPVTVDCGSRQQSVDASSHTGKVLLGTQTCPSAHALPSVVHDVATRGIRVWRNWGLEELGAPCCGLARPHKTHARVGDGYAGLAPAGHIHADSNHDLKSCNCKCNASPTNRYADQLLVSRMCPRTRYESDTDQLRIRCGPDTKGREHC
eukprot:366197-Chlamydomonas_euryale.AAC.17